MNEKPQFILFCCLGWAGRVRAEDPRPQVRAERGQRRVRRHVQLDPRHSGGRDHHSRRRTGRFPRNIEVSLQ